MNLVVEGPGIVGILELHHLQIVEVAFQLPTPGCRILGGEKSSRKDQENHNGNENPFHAGKGRKSIDN